MLPLLIHPIQPLHAQRPLYDGPQLYHLNAIAQVLFHQLPIKLHFAVRVTVAHRPPPAHPFSLRQAKNQGLCVSHLCDGGT